MRATALDRSHHIRSDDDDESAPALTAAQPDEPQQAQKWRKHRDRNCRRDVVKHPCRSVHYGWLDHRQNLQVCGLAKGAINGSPAP